MLARDTGQQSQAASSIAFVSSLDVKQDGHV